MIPAAKMRRLDVRIGKGMGALWECNVDMGRLESGDVFRFVDPGKEWDGNMYIAIETPYVKCGPAPCE
jgi:hypothetical protein